MKYNGCKEAFVAAFHDAIAQAPGLVLVSADSMLAARAAHIAKEHPEHFVEVGIGEQCAVDAAAGMAESGLTPVVVTYAGFLTMRACEQIRTFVAYPELNVKLVGLNGGMMGGEREGVTHQFYEDIGILRSIPGITILCPSDAGQTYLATLEMLRMKGPCYMRLASGKEADLFAEQPAFEIGKARIIVHRGTDFVLFTQGFVLGKAMEAVRRLAEEGIFGRLVEVPTLRPLDETLIGESLQTCKAAVVYEDHGVYGGLGSAICQLAAGMRCAPVCAMGLKEFAESGTADELLAKYHLDVPDVVSAVEKMCGK